VRRSWPSRGVAVYRSLLRPRTLGRDDVLEGEEVVAGFGVTVAEIFEP
jgi:hypothetical protein